MNEMQFENEPCVYIAAFSVEPHRICRAQLAFHIAGVPDFAWSGSASLAHADERAALCDDATNYAEQAWRGWLTGLYDVLAPQLF